MKNQKEYFNRYQKIDDINVGDVLPVSIIFPEPREMIYEGEVNGMLAFMERLDNKNYRSWRAKKEHVTLDLESKSIDIRPLFSNYEVYDLSQGEFKDKRKLVRRLR
jgi:hypothetical protein